MTRSSEKLKLHNYWYRENLRKLCHGRRALFVHNVNSMYNTMHCVLCAFNITYYLFNICIVYVCVEGMA